MPLCRLINTVRCDYQRHIYQRNMQNLHVYLYTLTFISGVFCLSGHIKRFYFRRSFSFFFLS